MEQRFRTEILTTPLSDAELDDINQVNKGLSQTLGIVITHVSSASVEGFLDVTPAHHQITGVANGGLYCAIGETIGSIAAVAASGKAAVGMNNNTDLLASVKQGRIEAEAIPVHVGKATHLWRVEMRHEDKLVATTNLKLMILRPQP